MNKKLQIQNERSKVELKNAVSKLNFHLEMIFHEI